MSTSLAPVLFVSHGGGPLPLLNDRRHQEMLSSFDTIRKDIQSNYEKPKAILVISAHWEDKQFSVGSNPAPEMIYDYGGFPPESYSIQYKAPGQPDLAQEVLQLLRSQQLPTEINDQRGFDHGVFVPLKILFPEANIPVVTLSLQNQFDPLTHINLGRVLAELRTQGIMIIGSGMTFHNLPLLFDAKNPLTQSASQEFTGWLDHTLEDPELNELQRTERLVNWLGTPHARMAHPREEHLLPVHVCYGAAQSQIKQRYAFNIMDVPARCYLW